MKKFEIESLTIFLPIQEMTCENNIMHVRKIDSFPLFAYFGIELREE